MKGEYNIRDSYAFNHSELDEESFFSLATPHEIEIEMCRLQPLSLSEHRKLARAIYRKVNQRIAKVQDDSEKNELKQLAHLIDMKIKVI